MNALSVRIASSAMILSTSKPNESMLIAESAMQNAGLSPLLFEVSLVLLAWYEPSCNSCEYFSKLISFFGTVVSRGNLGPENRSIPSH